MRWLDVTKYQTKTPFSTTNVKFEQHCFSKCHHMTKCSSFLVKTTSNINPIRCHFYDTTTTNLTNIEVTTDDTKLFTDIQDCQDLLNLGYKNSGVYSMNFFGKGQRDIRCNMENEDGGWIVILYRMAGQYSWNVVWDQYKNGIGDISGDFYLGNELIHQITDSGQYELYYTTETRTVDSPRAEPMYFGWYGYFHVSNEADYYRLSVSGHKLGLASLASNNGMQFTTRDVDRDEKSGSCGNSKSGGFWWKKCGSFQPTGIYFHTNNIKCMGLHVPDIGRLCTKNFQMMVRRR